MGHLCKGPDYAALAGAPARPPLPASPGAEQPAAVAAAPAPPPPRRRFVPGPAHPHASQRPCEEPRALGGLGMAESWGQRHGNRLFPGETRCGPPPRAGAPFEELSGPRVSVTRPKDQA